MSLDVYLTQVQPTQVFEHNITHNLTKMASQVALSNGKNLYEVLWRPDEHGFQYAKDIADLLDEGWNILQADPEFFSQFNPDNGWGSYEGLCIFVYEYRNACWNNPEAEIGVSR